MQTCRRFKLFLCAGLTAAAISGCGGSSSRDTVPATVSIFNAHSVIFRNDSTMTMGYNEFGQLGDGTLTNRDVAAIVPGLGKMTGGAAGAAHTLVFNNQTSVVMAWGYNGYGQIGAGPDVVSTTAGLAYTNTPKPVQLAGDVSDVAAGSFHSLAIAAGKIYAWGYNFYGQLGDGTNTNRETPVAIASQDVAGANLPANALKVAGGGLHSLALFEEAGVTSVYAWGDNTYGQLGVSPFTVSSYNRPSKVSQITGHVEQIAAGNKFSLALEVVSDGSGITSQTLWGWGYGAAGQLAADPATLSARTAGNPETAYSDVVKALKTISGAPFITKIAAGFDHVLLLFSDGTVQAVGLNFYGQLGNNMGLSPSGNDTTVSSYEFVSTLNDLGAAPLSGATDIAAFGNHSMALVNGAWYGWGNNNFGQLGNTPPVSSAGNPKIPIRVLGF